MGAAGSPALRWGQQELFVQAALVTNSLPLYMPAYIRLVLLGASTIAVMASASEKISVSGSVLKVGLCANQLVRLLLLRNNLLVPKKNGAETDWKKGG